MNKRPLSITIISWIFIALGGIALVFGVIPHGDITAAQRIAELKGHWYVHLSRIVAAVSGVFMLYGFNWARWLLIVWLGFHVVIGGLHSPLKAVVHILLFIVILYFLNRPPALAFFRGTTNENVTNE